MRNGEKMYSEFEWRTLMDKTVRISAVSQKWKYSDLKRDKTSK